MTLRNPGRLAIHRRSDEIAFLQHRLRVLSAARDAQGQAPRSESRGPRVQPQASAAQRDLSTEIVEREYDLADELLHTRQIEPLGETLQRRLAMAERVCRDLVPSSEPSARRSTHPGEPAGSHQPTKQMQRLASSETSANELREEQGGEPDGPGGQGCLPDAYWVAEVERRALAEMLKHWWAWLREA
jgi:hypothetical protein